MMNLPLESLISMSMIFQIFTARVPCSKFCSICLMASHGKDGSIDLSFTVSFRPNPRFDR